MVTKLRIESIADVVTLQESAPDRKLTAEHTADYPELVTLASDFLKSKKSHGHEFLDSVLEFGIANGRITRKQIAGILNIMVAGERMRRKMHAPVALSARPAPGTLEQQLFGDTSNQPQSPISSGGKFSPSSIPAEGFYTVILDEEDDDYITLRVESASWVKNPPLPDGSVSVKYLAGQDNTTDYAGFAFLVPNTQFEFGTDIRVWNRFKQNGRLKHALVILLQNADDAGMEYVLRSGNCRRCGRMLTVPVSINQGYGPECIKKIGA